MFSSIKDEDDNEVYTPEEILASINENTNQNYKYLQ